MNSSNAGRSASRKSAARPSSWARSHLSTARLKKPGLRLVDDPVGDQAARDLLEEVLGRAAVDLERGRDRGCKLDDLVVEKRHPHLERVRHRYAVGVVEHVVDEPELRVEEERRRRADRRRGRRRSAPRPRVRARDRCGAERGRASAEASRRDTAREARGSGRRVVARRSRPRTARSDLHPPKTASAALRPALRQRPASLDERRTAVPRIAGEELICSLPGDGDGHVLRGELAEHHEAERREVGEGLVERPDEILEARRRVGHRQLELVVIGAERSCDERARRRARAGRRPRRSPPRTSSPARSCCAPSARRAGSSRAPPLSIAPSGTSLIRRSSTACSSFARSSSAAAASVRLGSGVGMRKAPVRLDGDTVVDHQPVARLQLPAPGRAASRGRRRTRRSDMRRSLRGRGRVDEAARQNRFQLGGEDEEIADDRVVERFDAETVARDQRAPAFRPRRRGRTSPTARRKLVLDLLVEVGEDLGVAAAAEAVAAIAELAANGVVVVELAVLDRPDRSRPRSRTADALRRRR